MNKSRLLGAVCACLAVFSFSANAALLSVDLNTFGDGLITRDDSTGLDWLDLTETNNTSRDYVLTQLGSGGLFDGWRYATSTEVVALWADNFGIDLGLGASPSSPTVDPGVQMAASFLGNIINETYPGFYDYGTTGVTSTVSTNYYPQYDLLGAYHQIGSPSTSYLTRTNSSLATSSSQGDAGHYLVQTSPVPVPAAVWLFGSGLLGLIGIARSKKAA